MTLEELIVRYGTNKADYDSLKKVVDADNSEIKKLMSEQNINEYSYGGYNAKMTIQNRESINEEKLLTLLGSVDNLPNDIIKTKSYVDMDVLESAIYNNLIPNDVLIEMNKCREIKQVQTLKITKSKKGE